MPSGLTVAVPRVGLPVMVNFSAGLSGSTALRLPLTTPLVLGPDWPGRSVGVWLKKAAARPEKRALNGSVGCWAAAALGPAGLSGWAVDGEAACSAAARGLPSVRDAAAAAIHDTGDSIGLSPAGSMLRSGSGSRAARRGEAMVRIGAATAAVREVLGGSTASRVF